MQDSLYHLIINEENSKTNLKNLFFDVDTPYILLADDVILTLNYTRL